MDSEYPTKYVRRSEYFKEKIQEILQEIAVGKADAITISLVASRGRSSDQLITSRHFWNSALRVKILVPRPIMLPQTHTVILVFFTLLLYFASVSTQLLPVVIVTKTLIGTHTSVFVSLPGLFLTRYALLSHAKTARPTNDVVPSSWPTMGTGIPSGLHS